MAQSSVTREGVLSGQNREMGIEVLQNLILLHEKPTFEVYDYYGVALDLISGYVVKQIEEDRKEKYGGQNEGV